MRVSKTIAPMLATFVLCIGSLILPMSVQAETIEQDGLSVSYITDKDEYSSSDTINATLKVTNNSSVSVYEVKLDKAIPEGYIVVDGSNKYKTVAELKSGETFEFGTAFVKKSSGNNVEYTPTSNTKNSSITNTASTTAVTGTVSTTAAQTSTTNNTDSGNKNVDNPNTGIADTAVLYILAVLTVGGFIVSVKSGKNNKMFSLILVGTMLTTLLSGSNMNVKAVGKNINIIAKIMVDGKDMELNATVSFSTENDNPSVAEEYYNENAEILNVIDVSAEETLSEAEVTKLLNEKGFTDYPITYNYALSGDFGSDQESSSSSDVKHPMYGTYYISKNNEIWYITVVGKDIFANPMSFNIQTERNVPTMLSVSNSIIGYDDEKNRLYTIIPKKTAMIIVEVEDINSEVLDSLTVEEVGKL